MVALGSGAELSGPSGERPVLHLQPDGPGPGVQIKESRPHEVTAQREQRGEEPLTGAVGGGSGASPGRHGESPSASSPRDDAGHALSR